MEEEKVDHPKHYNQYPIEVIDMMVSIWGKEKAIDFCIMNGSQPYFSAGLIALTNIKSTKL